MRFDNPQYALGACNESFLWQSHVQKKWSHDRLVSSGSRYPYVRMKKRLA